jgi:outer membrane protein assembly factor BamD (BamD/ComL family)
LPEWYEQALYALEKGDKQKAQTRLAKIIAIQPTYEQASRYLHLAVTGVEPNKPKISQACCWIARLFALIIIGGAVYAN